MEKYAVKNIYGARGSLFVTVPGSKSITNRALLIAALAEGESVLDGVLFSDDSRHFMDCIQRLGIKTEIDEKNCVVKIQGCGGKLPVKKAEINVGSAGTAARFLTAFLAMSEGEFLINSSEQMKKRPMKPLLSSLEELGAEVIYHEKEGFFPFTVIGHTPAKTEIEVDIDKSSQFLSAVLISSCLCRKGLNIHVKGSHGMNYIKITTDMMRDFGIDVKSSAGSIFKVAPDSGYKGRSYNIEADASGAAYFYAMGAILGVKVKVKNIFFSSVQGDIEFIRLLEKMGCKTGEDKDGVWLEGPKDGHIKGISADLSAFSDQALTLAAIAPYADSPVTISGISHIRGQECDRIEAIRHNLTAMGVKAVEENDVITIFPSQPKPAEIETYDDHRVAMSFAVTGLRSGGITIKNPLCCRKTFENFFEIVESIIKNFSI